MKVTAQWRKRIFQVDAEPAAVKIEQKPSKEQDGQKNSFPGQAHDKYGKDNAQDSP
jgi:hypothetical protein